MKKKRRIIYTLFIKIKKNNYSRRHFSNIKEFQKRVKIEDQKRIKKKIKNFLENIQSIKNSLKYICFTYTAMEIKENSI